MRFDEGTDLDTSQVDDQRGRGGIGGRVAVGGGGVGLVGLLLYFLLSQLAGGPSSPLPNGLPNLGTGQTADDTQINQSCRQGSDANTKLDCEVVGVDNSLDAYWSDTFSRAGQPFRKPRITFFNGGGNTGWVLPARTSARSTAQLIARSTSTWVFSRNFSSASAPKAVPSPART